MREFHLSYFSLSYLRKIPIFWKIQFTKNNIYIVLCCNMCMLTHVKRMFAVFTNVMVWYYMCYITSITSYNIFPILFFFFVGNFSIFSKIHTTFPNMYPQISPKIEKKFFFKNHQSLLFFNIFIKQQHQTHINDSRNRFITHSHVFTFYKPFPYTN